MDLSIVVTTRNRYNDLLSCLHSIAESDLKDVVYEVLVVDDNSTDATAQLTGFAGIGHLTVVHNEAQSMMVKSRNIGAKLAAGAYVLFVDDDNEVDRLMIKSLLEGFSHKPDAGILGPSMYYHASRQKYLDFQKINMFTGKTFGIVDQSDNLYCSSDGIPNVFIVKKEVFLSSGYFDETLLQTFTEPDFSFSAKKHGYKTYVYKKAKTFHKTTADANYTERGLGGMYEQKAYCLMRNRVVIVARYGTLVQKLVFLLFFSWIWPLVYSLLIIKRRRFRLVYLYWKGYFAGLYYLFFRSFGVSTI